MSEQKIKKPAAVISVAIQKGGSAKTTLAVNLAAELGSQGYNVLIIDVDPQANASAHISVAHPSTLSKNASTLFRGNIEEIMESIQVTIQRIYFMYFNKLPDLLNFTEKQKSLFINTL